MSPLRLFLATTIVALCSTSALADLSPQTDELIWCANVMDAHAATAAANGAQDDVDRYTLSAASFRSRAEHSGELLNLIQQADLRYHAAVQSRFTMGNIETPYSESECEVLR
jgi:hypothetical protein